MTLEPEILLVTCISDNEEFAPEVYEYLILGLERQRMFKEGGGLRPDRQLITLQGNEIRVDSKSMVPKEMVKWILQNFLRENKDKFNDYDVIEFGDVLTIGRILHPSEMEMATCEICGFFTPYEAELQTHRMTHFGV